MHRPRPTFWIATATVAALALGGGVAAARAGAPARPTRDAAPSTSAAPTGECAPGGDDTATTTTLPSSVPTAPPQAPPVNRGGPGDPWVEDHDPVAAGVVITGPATGYHSSFDSSRRRAPRHDPGRVVAFELLPPRAHVV